MDYPVSDTASPSEMLPNLCLNDRDVEAIKKLEVGQTYTLTIQAKVKSKEERESSGDKKVRTHVDFALANVKIGRKKAYDKKVMEMGG